METRIFWKRRIAARVTEGLHDEGRDGMGKKEWGMKMVAACQIISVKVCNQSSTEGGWLASFLLPERESISFHCHLSHDQYEELQQSDAIGWIFLMM